MILGHNNPRILEAVIKACEKGLSYGAATEKEVEMAELICRHRALHRYGPHGKLRNRGCHERSPGGQRLHRKKQDCEIHAAATTATADAMLVQAGSGVMTAGIPDSAGVPGGCTKDTLSAVYNDVDSVKTLFETFPEEIAAVIVEPVAANMGVVEPKREFLQGLRDLCTKYGAVLIFDEVITGFRLQLDGAQGYLRHSAGYDHLWKNHWRRYARWRLRRKTGDHEPGLTSRPGLSGRYFKRQPGGHVRRPCPA